jgi:hypothetical protein
MCEVGGVRAEGVEHQGAQHVADGQCRLEGVVGEGVDGAGAENLAAEESREHRGSVRGQLVELDRCVSERAAGARRARVERRLPVVRHYRAAGVYLNPTASCYLSQSSSQVVS